MNMRSRTICMIFLFLSISGLVVLAAAQTAYAQQTVGVYAKTTAGVYLSGVRVTITWQLTSPTRWVSANYVTPITIFGPGQTTWTFTAPMSATIGGVKYSFVRWEAGSLYSGGYTVSASNSFSYFMGFDRSFFAVYSQPQTSTTTTRTTRTTQTALTGKSCGYIEYMMGQCSVGPTTPSSNLYTVYLIVKSGTTGVSVAGLKVYVDNTYVGQTDSYGTLTITNVTAGSHKFALKSSAGTFTATQYVSNNLHLTLTLVD